MRNFFSGLFVACALTGFVFVSACSDEDPLVPPAGSSSSGVSLSSAASGNVSSSMSASSLSSGVSVSPSSATGSVSSAVSSSSAAASSASSQAASSTSGASSLSCATIAELNAQIPVSEAVISPGIPIEGVVHAVKGAGRFWVQDATGGIYVYNITYTNLPAPGDVVRLVVTKGMTYLGLKEITAYTGYTVVSQGAEIDRGTGTPSVSHVGRAWKLASITLSADLNNDTLSPTGSPIRVRNETGGVIPQGTYSIVGPVGVSTSTPRIHIYPGAYTNIGSGSSSSSGTSSSASVAPTSHTELGVPDDGNADGDYVISRTQYVLSYNRYTACANWVAWNMNASWVGSAARQDDFRADPLIPSGYPVVSETEYSGSGYDRGHLCPSADRTASVEDNSATFFMSNMIPQKPNLNRYLWESLEEYCRVTLSQGENRELYILAGGIYQNPWATVNNAGKIGIPTHTWKIIVVLDRGQGLAHVTTSTRVIAVKMQQDVVSPYNWREHRVTVDQLEAETGYNFLNLVPAGVQSVIESRVDTE